MINKETFKFEKLFEFYTKSKIRSLVNVVLLLLVVLGGYLIYNGIDAPIRFQEEKNKRYEELKKVLDKLRDFQLAHKEIKGKYSKSFDKLFDLVENERFVLTQKRDTVIKYYDNVYRIDKEKEVTLIDTLGFIPVKDSLFAKGGDINSLRFVPFSKSGAEFKIQAGILETNGLKVPVFEISTPKTEVLSGMNKDMVRQEEDALDIKGKVIKIGSMTEATVNGNW